MSMRVQAIAAALWAGVALPAAAQDETALRRGLEGKYVTVKLDLPATEKGLDLRFDRTEPFDSRENDARLRECDVAVPQGERAQVSQVKVKGDHVEFQLDGGGFDWARDATTESFAATPKSEREKDLERQIRSESDPARKRDLEDDRERLRREREHRDEWRRRDVEERNVEARRRDRERARRSGSRINLRFKKHVPPDALTAEGLLRYLEPWVTLEQARASHGPR